MNHPLLSLTNGKVTEPLPTTVMVPLDAQLAHHIAPGPAPAGARSHQ